MPELIKMPHKPDASVQMEHRDISSIRIGGSEGDTVSTAVRNCTYRIHNIGERSLNEPGSDTSKQIQGKPSIRKDGTKLN